MREGDVFGHEFMGEVVETGPEVTRIRTGTRVVVPSFISCGSCWYCDHDLPSVCDTTNPNAHLQQPVFGYPTGGIYGYTHPFGGYQGSHAEYIRCRSPTPIASRARRDIRRAGPVPLRCGADRYMGADFCDISAGDTVAVWAPAEWV